MADPLKIGGRRWKSRKAVALHQLNRIMDEAQQLEGQFPRLAGGIAVATATTTTALVELMQIAEEEAERLNRRLESGGAGRR